MSLRTESPRDPPAKTADTRRRAHTSHARGRRNEYDPRLSDKDKVHQLYQTRSSVEHLPVLILMGNQSGAPKESKVVSIQLALCNDTTGHATHAKRAFEWPTFYSLRSLIPAVRRRRTDCRTSTTRSPACLWALELEQSRHTRGCRGGYPVTKLFSCHTSSTTNTPLCAEKLGESGMHMHASGSPGKRHGSNLLTWCQQAI